MNFPKGNKPDADYEAWRENWTPPKTHIAAMPGWAIVEFGPIANRGAIIQPGAVSYNAKVVSDGNQLRAHREGYLPTGTEIIYFTNESTPLEIEGRTLHRVRRSRIQIYLPKESEAA